MSFLYKLFLFGVALFGFMMIVGVVQARRKKENLYYSSSAVAFLVVLAFASAFLNQLILAFILAVAAGICSIAGLPKMLRLQERELANRLQNVDFSAPLRRRYFLSDVWWLNLASKWGLWKTMCLFYLVSTGIVGGILFVLNMLTSFITIEYVVAWTAASSILVTLMFWRQFKRALKKSTPHKS